MTDPTPAEARAICITCTLTKKAQCLTCRYFADFPEMEAMCWLSGSADLYAKNGNLIMTIEKRF